MAGLAVPKLKRREPFERIAFYGPMASGKSYAARYLVDGGNFVRVGFADKLKALAYDLYGIQDKNGIGRKFLQEFSDDCKKWDPDLFIKHFLYKVRAIEEGHNSPKIICDDLRYLREAKALKKNGFTLIRVNCDEVVRANRISKLYPNLDIAQTQHQSETEFSLIDSLTDKSINSTDINVVLELEDILNHA